MGLFMSSFLGRGIIQECFELIQLKVNINRSEELHMFYSPAQNNPRREASPFMHSSILLWSTLVRLVKPGELPLISVLQPSNSRTDVRKKKKKIGSTDPTSRLYGSNNIS